MADVTAGAVWGAVAAAVVAAASDMGAPVSAFVGAGFGAVIGAPSMPKLGAVLRFLTPISITVGSALGGSYLVTAKDGKAFAAFCIASVFYVILGQATKRIIPAVVDGYAARFGAAAPKHEEGGKDGSS